MLVQIYKRRAPPSSLLSPDQHNFRAAPAGPGVVETSRVPTSPAVDAVLATPSSPASPRQNYNAATAPRPATPFPEIPQLRPPGGASLTIRRRASARVPRARPAGCRWRRPLLSRALAAAGVQLLVELRAHSRASGSRGSPQTFPFVLMDRLSSPLGPMPLSRARKSRDAHSARCLSAGLSEPH